MSRNFPSALLKNMLLLFSLKHPRPHPPYCNGSNMAAKGHGGPRITHRRNSKQLVAEREAVWTEKVDKRRTTVP